MAYDQGLADRLDERLGGKAGFTSKHMFGGKMWWYQGNILGGAAKEGLLVKVAPIATEKLLREDGVSPFAPGARPVKGWLAVALEAVDSEEALDRWLKLAIDEVKTLPPKG